MMSCSLIKSRVREKIVILIIKQYRRSARELMAYGLSVYNMSSIFGDIKSTVE